MKHSDLKVGMKVKRVNMFSDRYFTSTKGNISTVKEIEATSFSTCEDMGRSWEAQYFEPVIGEQVKEEVMQKIDINKKYKTRCGYPVRILCTDVQGNEYSIVYLYTLDKEHVGVCTIYGYNYLDKSQSPFDLIEVSPWEDFKKDDKVMVSEEGAHWTRRYFAYAQNSSAFCYSHGADSWSACPDNDLTSWRYCRKPTQEELGEE